MAVVESFVEFERGASEPSGAGLRVRTVASVTRLWPFFSGSERVSNHPALRRVAGAAGGFAWAPVVGGALYAPLDDHVGRAAFYVGDLDPKVSWVIDRAAVTGGVALDVGANLGLMTLRLALRVGSSGVVHAFEPNPRVAAYLSRTLARNALGQVTLHRIGLGAANGELTLHVPADNLGSASFSAVGPLDSVQSHRAPVRRLDGIIDPDLDICVMKMDVEGFEAEVMRGASRLLERRNVGCIVFEEHGVRADQPLPETIRMVQDAGYVLYALPRRAMTSMRLLPLQEALRAGRTGHDYVAVAPDAGRTALRHRLGLR